jgi:STE24 endopeptidase
VTPNADAPNDALALVLFMMVVPVASFIVTPLASRASRRQ